MEERKAWEALLKDPQRSYDAQCKKILSLKKILAYLYKECLSEYRHLSLKEIYDRLDTDPTSNKVVSQNVEDLKMPDSKVCYDLLFKLAHPKDPKRRLWVDMESQGIDLGKGKTKRRGKDTMEVLILYPRRRYRYDFY